MTAEVPERTDVVGNGALSTPVLACLAGGSTRRAEVTATSGVPPSVPMSLGLGLVALIGGVTLGVLGVRAGSR